MRLVIRDLEKNFDKNVVLDQAGYTFEQGKIYGLIGKPGAGKTTLLHCIMGECEYDNGIVLILRNSVATTPDNQDIGIVFHTPVLPEFMTPYEFVKYYMDIHSLRLNSEATPLDYLQEVGVKEEDAFVLIKDLTSEIKNRLQLIYIKIASPSVILVDEPFEHYEESAVEELKVFLNGILEDHVIIIGTSNLQMAEAMSHELVLLEHGVLTGISKAQLAEPGFQDQLSQRLLDTQEEEHA